MKCPQCGRDGTTWTDARTATMHDGRRVVNGVDYCKACNWRQLWQYPRAVLPSAARTKET